MRGEEHVAMLQGYVVSSRGLPPTSFLTSVPFLNVSPKHVIIDERSCVQHTGSTIAVSFSLQCPAMGGDSILILVDNQSYLWGQTKHNENLAGMVQFKRHEFSCTERMFVRWSPSTAIDSELKALADEVEIRAPPCKKRRLG